MDVLVKKCSTVWTMSWNLKTHLCLFEFLYLHGRKGAKNYKIMPCMWKIGIKCKIQQSWGYLINVKNANENYTKFYYVSIFHKRLSHIQMHFLYQQLVICSCDTENNATALYFSFKEVIRDCFKRTNSIEHHWQSWFLASEHTMAKNAWKILLCCFIWKRTVFN